MPHSVMKEYDLAKICRAKTNLNVLGHHCLWVQQYILGCQALTYVRKYRSYLMPGGVVKNTFEAFTGTFYFLAVSSGGSQTGNEGQKGGFCKHIVSHRQPILMSWKLVQCLCNQVQIQKKRPFRFSLVLWKSTLQTKMLHHYFHSLSTDHTLHTVHSLSELEFNFAVSFSVH